MKKEQTTKTVFFKSLQKLIDDFKIVGVKEVKTIALVYQVAFKIIEATSDLKRPIAYQYQTLDINKEVVDKHIDEVKKCAFFLLETIEECEAFHDLMSNYIEEIRATNTSIAQYFTPIDVAQNLSSFILFGKTVDEFEQYNKYVTMSDPSGCGAGSLVLGLLRSLKYKVKGFEDKHYQSINLYINELDVDLAKIAFFQVLINSLVHSKLIGIIHCEAKDLVTEYEKPNVNLNLFVCDIERKNAADQFERFERVTKAALNM